eukprot:5883636-Alexandrium_andersonii.AAC.1
MSSMQGAVRAGGPLGACLQGKGRVINSAGRCGFDVMPCRLACVLPAGCDITMVLLQGRGAWASGPAGSGC